MNNKDINKQELQAWLDVIMVDNSEPNGSEVLIWFGAKQFYKNKIIQHLNTRLQFYDGMMADFERGITNIILSEIEEIE